MVSICLLLVSQYVFNIYGVCTYVCKVPARGGGLAPAQEARRPLPPALPRPRRAGGAERSGVPSAPEPLAGAQGAGFLEEISRKSAGPPASGSPPNPAGARSSAAPLAAPGEGRGGGAGSRPASTPEKGGGGSGCSAGAGAEEGPYPAAADNHLSPSPH